MAVNISSTKSNQSIGYSGMQTTNQSPLGLVSTLPTGQQSKAENDQSHIVTQLHGKDAYNVYSSIQQYRDSCDLGY